VAGLSKLRSIPSFVTPMAAHTVAKLPEGSEWLYELKLDGSPYLRTVNHGRFVLSAASVRRFAGVISN
jgi:ATP-dependent DNA ligase